MAKQLISGRHYFHGRKAKWMYEYLGWQFKDATEVRFMNYGYAHGDTADNIDLQAEDENERYPAQLYNLVASQADLTGAVMLDVGSGRGGGASHIHRYLGPSTTTGMDLASSAVAFCQKIYADVGGLTYMQGDSMDLPFETDHFDAVTNVESSHCYPDRTKFFEEVRRVLKPGGVFLYTDFFDEGLDAVSELKQAGFADIAEQDITKGVVAGLDFDTQRRELEINTRFPFGLRRIARLWAGTQGSWIYDDFVHGRRRYLMYRVKAPV